MKLFLQNKDDYLVPLYPSDYEEKKKLKKDRVYSCEIKYERNYEFHKKFFALCKIGCEYSKTVEMPFDAFREYITIKAGYAEIYLTPKGKFVRAKSISFAKMEQEEFEMLYSRVLDKIILDTDFNKQEIEKNLLSFM